MSPRWARAAFALRLGGALSSALWLAACQTLPLEGKLPRENTAAASTVPAAAPPARAAAGHASASAPATAQAPADPAASVPARSEAPASPALTTSELPGVPRGVPPELFHARDAWGRLRRGFALPPLPHALAEKHARRFAEGDFFGRRADRLRLYLPLIVAELEQRGLPLELAMLPLVESALNPQARSPVGALGTWQFMAPTARRFELRTSRLVDDRKNLLAATRAAMDYLQTLHRQFGDWHLAMAAYNWGEGRVQRLASRHREQGLPVSFAAMAAAMPAETRNYVPQIDALRRLVDSPAAFGVTLPELPDGHPLEEVAISADIDLALVLRLSGLSERAFLALNPALRPPVVLASATPRLLMPDDAAERFSQRLAGHQGRLANWSVVRLASTKPVDAIAAQHSTTARALREANDIPRGMKPLAGSVLLLPVAPRAGTKADEGVVASAQLTMAPDVVKVRTLVRAGERAADVARRMGVDLRALLRWNGLPAKRAARPLRRGSQLLVWVPRESTATQAAPGCRRRSRLEPPCRADLGPRVEAGSMTVGFGTVLVSSSLSFAVKG